MPKQDQARGNRAWRGISLFHDATIEKAAREIESAGGDSADYHASRVRALKTAQEVKRNYCRTCGNLDFCTAACEAGKEISTKEVPSDQQAAEAWAKENISPDAWDVAIEAFHAGDTYRASQQGQAVPSIDTPEKWEDLFRQSYPNYPLENLPTETRIAWMERELSEYRLRQVQPVSRDALLEEAAQPLHPSYSQVSPAMGQPPVPAAQAELKEPT